MVRLLQRLTQSGEETEAFAGLVQVLRYCGLLDESVAAHHRAKALDPTIATSVCHSHFLRGEYEATIENYVRGTGFYLDAAAWAALGDTDRAVSLLRERVAAPQLGPLMSGLMGSLLAILEGRDRDAQEAITKTEVVRDPEVMFYFARHFSMLGDAARAIEMLARAQKEGFTALSAIKRDPAFSAVREHPEFERVASEARSFEGSARRAFEEAGGRRLLRM